MDTQSTENIAQLEKIYTDVSEWLKFLELKHAGMLAAWVAVFVAVISTDNINNRTTWWILVAICLFGIGVCLVPFWPFLNKYNFMKNMCYRAYAGKSGTNALFYRDIFVTTYVENRREDTIRNYKEMLQRELNIETDTQIARAYAMQIVDVSTVATIKAYWFNILATYTVINLVLGVLLVLIA